MDPMKALLKRLAALVVAGGFAASVATAGHAEDKTIRVGFQKYGTLVLLKTNGLLEEKLKPLGWSVAWTEFPAGPQLLEALNVGAIDFGTTGEAPPIFAQAAGAPLVYVGYEPPAPRGEAILVAKDSPIRSVADLKGKTVALNKGSNVHYLLVRLLEKNGLKYSDVTPVFLPPADARAAFETGAVDAWVIWDPFLAAAERQLGARQLADGTGLVNSFSFYLAQTGYAKDNPDVIRALFANTDEAARYVQADVPRAAAQIAPLQGLDVAVAETSLKRYRYGARPLTPAVAAQQQQIADTFFDLKLIPRPVRIADALPAAAGGPTVAGK